MALEPIEVELKLDTKQAEKDIRSVVVKVGNLERRLRRIESRVAIALRRTDGVVSRGNR